MKVVTGIRSAHITYSLFFKIASIGSVQHKFVVVLLNDIMMNVLVDCGKNMTLIHMGIFDNMPTVMAKVVILSNVPMEINVKL